jgi:tungstate transport system substrate-binding protein
MEKGYGVERRLVMHNDFVIVGPSADPAGIASAASAAEALQKIASTQSPFATRGDNSVVDRLETFLWKKAKVNPTGGWYFETARTMFETLTIAGERGAYTLADRTSYLVMQGATGLAMLYQGDPYLMNYYHVIVVNPEKFPELKIEAARKFAEYLVSPEAQKIIAEFGVDRLGQPAFFADGDKTDADLGLPEQDTED